MMTDSDPSFTPVLNRQVQMLSEAIMNEYGLSELDALRTLYASELYQLLSNESTKLWWHSAAALLEIYRAEKETGSVFDSPYLLENNAAAR